VLRNKSKSTLMPSQAPVAQTGLHLYAFNVEGRENFWYTNVIGFKISKLSLQLASNGGRFVVCRDHVGEEHLPHTFCFDDWEYDGCSSLKQG
jgi:hypothetical protein